ncbi:restriction endonuclease subunit S [Mycoplasma aquilae ATCC BAA-1896]|uniref:restriction endonuclease subunit S n=1 Tax=Mycoplasma aquilae TaxID=1312741 RepID=UPI003A84DEC1
MQKEKLVPAIRFKGFEEEWTKEILKKIVTTFSGLTNVAKEDFSVGENYYVTYLNVFSNPMAKLNDLEKVNVHSKQNNLIKGDILVTGSSETPEEVGMTSIWNYNLENVYLNSFCFGLRPKNLENINIDFSAYLFRSQSVRKQIILLAQGISRFNISKNKFLEVFLTFPIYAEQQKIGQFFSNLGSLIRTQELKLKKLNEVKQSLLNKMFASENQKFPEIRFKGFDEPWKLNKFSDLYNCNNEKNINIRYTEKNIISVANMYFKNEQKISNTEYLKSYNIFHLGDIAYEGHKSANYRYGRFVVNTIGSGIVSHVFEVFKPVMKEYDLYFWKYYINNENIMRNVLRDSTKSATMMAALVKKDLSNQFIKTTSILEQQKIGAFFSNLDSLISSQELKLEKLNNLKQALLEKMFC